MERVMSDGRAEKIVAATPFARKLARERDIDLDTVMPSGTHGEVRGRDVEKAVSEPKATPLAKAMAARMGIDLKKVSGTGYNGKIMSCDLQKTADETDANLDSAMEEIEEIIERRKLSGMRRVIAQRMCSSHSQIPAVTQDFRVDVTELLDAREKLNQGRDRDSRVSVTDMIIRATAIAVSEQERFRMTIEDDEYVLHSRVNIGVAVGIDEGLLVPVIRDADHKSLQEISEEVKALTKKSREGTLTLDETGGGRITVSNLGMYGLHSFTPLINQPEASIVGACAIEDELAMTEGGISVRKKMMICVTYDHRILNGAEVCVFESRLKELLEHPSLLL